MKLVLSLVSLLFFGPLAGCKQTTGNAQASGAAPPSLQASTQVSAKSNNVTTVTVVTVVTVVNNTSPAELMQAVFGDQYRAAKGNAIANLPDVKERTQRASYLVTAVAHKPLADGRMVLATNSQNHDDTENSVSSHADSGILSVFVLVKNGSRWQVEKRHENIAELGSMGQFGELEWVDLGKGKPGLVVHHGGTWQGTTIDFIALFDLSASQLHELASIKLYSDNDGACDEETEKCWNIRGKYRFVPNKTQPGFDDLVIDFSGEESALAVPAGKSRVKKAVKGSARYHFDGKTWVLVAGENLIPDV